jgi:hypothetical protein
VSAYLFISVISSYSVQPLSYQKEEADSFLTELLDSIIFVISLPFPIHMAVAIFSIIFCPFSFLSIGGVMHYFY